MPAAYLKDQLNGKARVSNVVVLNKLMLKVSINSNSFFGSSKEYTIYMPDTDDYIVNSDVVAKGIHEGADLLVCEPWCEITGEGFEYGKSKGIKVLSLGNFLSKIDNGEKI